MKQLFSIVVMLFTSFTIFAQSVDIELKLTVDKTNPVLYSPVTYTLVATNKSTNIFANAVVQFIDFSALPPATLGYVGHVEPLNTSFNNWKGVWTINFLAPGTSQTLTLTCNSLTTQLFSAKAKITSVSPADNNAANNEACAAINGIDPACTSNTVCDITPSVSTVYCDKGASTPTNTNDDTWGIFGYVNKTTANPTGWQILIGTTEVARGKYTEPFQIENLLVKNGATELIFKDLQDGTCFKKQTIAPPTNCPTGSPSPKPDFVLGNITTPSVLETNSAFSVGYSISNNTDIVPDTTVKTIVYLSKDTIPSADDFLIGQKTQSFLSWRGTEANNVFNKTLPPTFAKGSYFILIFADKDKQVAESNEQNNIVYRAVNVIDAASAVGKDTLRLVGIVPPASVRQGETVVFTVTLENTGTRASDPNEVLTLYQNREFQDAYNYMYQASNNVPIGVAIGAKSRITLPISFKLPDTITNKNWVIKFTDNNGNRGGSFRGNTMLLKKRPQGFLVAPSFLFQADTIGRDYILPLILDTLKISMRMDTNAVITPEGYLNFDSYVTNNTNKPLRNVSVLLGGRSIGSASEPFFDAEVSKGYVFSFIEKGFTMKTYAYIPDIAVGETVTIKNKVSRVFSSYYTIVHTAYSDQFEEVASNLVQNMFSLSTQPLPDLTISKLTTPSVFQQNTATSVSLTVKNIGLGDANASNVGIYLIKNNVSSLLTKRSVAAIPKGDSLVLTFNLTIPTSFAVGSYQIMAYADTDVAVAEVAESNNEIRNNFELRSGTPNASDLTLTNLTAPAAIPVGTAENITFDLKNIGSGVAENRYIVSAYISTDTILTQTDLKIGSLTTEYTAVGTSSQTIKINLPLNLALGNYHIIVKADAENNITELNENNNLIRKSVTLQSNSLAKPDLVVQITNFSDLLYYDIPFSNIQFKTTNIGNAPAGPFYLSYYWSVDSVFSPDDTFGGQIPYGEGLAPGASIDGGGYGVQANPLAAAYRYLVLSADNYKVVDEKNETNNLAISARVLFQSSRGCGDRFPPYIPNCPKDTVVITDTESATCKTISWQPIQVSDGCDPLPTVTQTEGLASGSCFPLGVTQVSFLAKNYNLTNNSRICTFKIRVLKKGESDCKKYNVENTNEICGTTTYKPFAMRITQNAQNQLFIAEQMTFDRDKNTAILRGSLRNAAWELAEVNINLSGGTDAPPTGSPTINACVPNSQGWKYFTTMSGTVKIGDQTFTLQNRGNAFQIGTAANLQNPEAFGGSGGFTLSNGSTGDFGFKLTNETTCVGAAADPVCDTDTIKPVLKNCPQDITIRLRDRNSTQHTFMPATTATDNCGVPTVTSNPPSDYYFPIGATTVIYTATDAKNNTATCSVVVTIVREVDPCESDTTKPVITCLSNITKTITGDSTLVTWIAPTATDNCVTPAVNSNYNSPAMFKVGTTKVIYTAVDFKRNTAVCAFDVIVIKQTSAPCKKYTVINTNNICGNDWRPYAIFLTKNGVRENLVEDKVTLENSGTTAILRGTFRNAQWQPVTVTLNLSGGTSTAPAGSPRTNACSGNGTDYSYFTSLSGTMTIGGQNFNITRRGAAFQIGVGADLQNPRLLGANGQFILSDSTIGEFGFKIINETACDGIVPFVGQQKSALHLVAKAKFDRTHLMWFSNAGYKTDYFEVQKAEKSGIFKTISRINSIHFDAKIQEYTFETTQNTDNLTSDFDETYRIKAMYQDGSFDLSDAQTVYFSKPTDLVLYPNPAAENINLELKNYNGKAVKILIYNMLGVLQKEVEIEAASNDPHNQKVSRLSISTENMADGSYFLTIKSKGLRDVVKRFMIHKE